MGIKADWQIQIEKALKGSGIDFNILDHQYFHLLISGNKRLILNLVPFDHNFTADDFINLQNGYRLAGTQVVHLWEDVWKNKPAQVLSRIGSVLGLNKRIHGRKTTIQSVTKKEADDFFDLYHLQGPVKIRYKYALNFEGETVAVAGFSGKRTMKNKGENYTSIELIRFATKDGYTVTGGLTKLIKHLIKQAHPDDVMSYADRDWSLGRGYEVSGFKLDTVTPAADIWLDKCNLKRYFPHRIPEVTSDCLLNDYIKIFNTGNLKYVLCLND